MQRSKSYKTKSKKFGKSMLQSLTINQQGPVKKRIRGKALIRGGGTMKANNRPKTEDSSIDEVLADYNENEQENLRETVKELKSRVEQLEVSNDTTQYNLNILSEVVKIVSEFPAGRQIVNRAINRYKLFHLLDVILPRRKRALAEIEKETSMPKGIRDSFVRRELSMIHRTNRAIDKRQSYELEAAKNVKVFFDKVSDFLDKHRRKLPVLAIHKDKH